MNSVFAIRGLRRRGMIGFHPLNPYGSGRYIVLVIGILLIALVPLDWAFPSGTRATQLGVADANRAIPQVIRGAILILMLLYVAMTGWDPSAYGFVPGRTLFLLAAYMLLSVFFNSTGLSSRFVVFAKSTIWMAAAIASHRLTLGGCLSAARIRRLTAAVVICASACTIPFCLDPGHRIGQNADGSVLLWCIPLLLLAHPPLWASGLAGLASVAVLVTVKRGSILALFAGALVYSAMSSRMSSRKFKVRNLIIVALLMATISGALVWQWENIEHRMEKDFDRGDIGSGRASFYRVILAEWYNGGVFSLFFGEGFFTVLETLDAKYGERIYAHSDWLETLHDMGLVGVALLACLHFQLIRLVLSASRRRAPVAPAFAMGYCIFALRNIYSQCVVGPSETIYFGLLLGYAAAATNYWQIRQS